MVKATNVEIAQPIENDLTASKVDRSFFAVVIFSGLGLLISLFIIIADQQITGEWF